MAYCWAATVLFSVSGNILFFIASRKTVLSGKIDGEQAALFRHYCVCSLKLAKLLEGVWHHWEAGGMHLIRPLRETGTATVLVSELEAFKTLYRDHLEALAFEIPEFDSSALPLLPSDTEYLDVLRALRAHGAQLAAAAKFVEDDSK
jgi:hypothetical protein